MIDLPQINDPEWLKLREKQWKRRYLSYYQDREKDEVEKHRQFFFSGNLKAYLDSFHIITFDEAFLNMPALEISQMIWLIQEYWSYAHDSKNGLKEHYLNFHHSSKDECFKTVLLFTINTGVWFHPPTLFFDLFIWAFGDDFQTSRTLDIGLDNWKPTFEVSYFEVGPHLLSGFREYLSDIELSESTSQFRYLLPYLLSVIALTPETYFNIELADRKKKNEVGGKLQAAQKQTRRFFSCIYGYSEVHLDIELEEAMRDAIEDLDMPDNFEEFKEFIHKYKNDSIRQDGL